MREIDAHKKQSTGQGAVAFSTKCEANKNTLHKEFTNDIGAYFKMFSDSVKSRNTKDTIIMNIQSSNLLIA